MEHGRQTFIVDVMLGKLARWMRILGLDTLYFNAVEDRELARLAATENRILVTRDHRLVERKLVRDRSFLIESENWKEQIKEFLGKCDCLGSIKPMSRCIVCNCLLRIVQRHSVKQLVPAFVYQNHNHFQQCPSCRRIYWPGTHGERINRMLAEFGIARTR